MKTKGSSIWMYTVMLAVIVFMASCGNSQKKKERATERRVTEQSIPNGTVVESETIVVEVDSIVPDTTVINSRTTTSKRTK